MRRLGQRPCRRRSYSNPGSFRQYNDFLHLRQMAWRLLDQYISTEIGYAAAIAKHRVNCRYEEQLDEHQKEGSLRHIPDACSR